MSSIELLQAARNSTDEQILSKLSKHQSSIVRRIVARNKNTPTRILEKLSYDPVMNVSYIAVNNSNNILVQRNLNESHPCVICDKDEIFRDCSNCEILNSYKVS